MISKLDARKGWLHLCVSRLSHAIAAQVEVQHSAEALPGGPEYPQGHARADGGALQSEHALADILNIIERALGASIEPDQPLMKVCSTFMMFYCYLSN